MNPVLSKTRENTGQTISEYMEVEQPFLQQLSAQGWEVIKLGQQIPSDPLRILRQDDS